MQQKQNVESSDAQTLPQFLARSPLCQNCSVQHRIMHDRERPGEIATIVDGKMMLLEEWVPLKVAAAFLSLAPQTLRNKRCNGTLLFPGRRSPSGRIFFNRDDLINFKRSYRQQ